METLQNILDAGWALRWLLALAALFILGCCYADALFDNVRLRSDNHELAARVDRLETSNRILLAHQRSRRERRPIISSRVSQ